MGTVTLAVVAVVYGLLPPDSISSRLRSVSDRFAAMDAVLDRATDRPSAVAAIRELDSVQSIPDLRRAYGDRVVREASAAERAGAAWAVAEMRQRLGRRLSKWIDDGWLVEADVCASPFLRTVTASFRTDAKERCEAVAKEMFRMNNRGWCDWPDVDELFHLAASNGGENVYRTNLRPDHFLNPWGGRVAVTILDLPIGPTPMAYANVWGESGWERVSHPLADLSL